MDTPRYVITHPDLGVYVGCALGLGFWSLLDRVGQNRVVTFPNEASAREHLAAWSPEVNANDYAFVAVTTSEAWAGKAVLTEAGLSALLGSMEDDDALLV